MRQKIDLASLYRDVLSAMPDNMGGQPPLPLPTA